MDRQGPDPGFEQRLSDELTSAYGAIAHDAAAPGRPRYRIEMRRRMAMSPIRLTLAAAGGALALAGSAVFASTAGLSLTAAGDSHGDAVSKAAHTCPTGTATDRDAHGDCVSSAARTNAGHAAAGTRRNHDQHGDNVSSVATSGPTGTSSDRDAHGDAVSAAARSPRP
jgi:hypothetical protein